MVKLLLVRHGEAIHADPEPVLSKKGKQQAKNVGEKLAQLHITKAYTSTAKRALETCEAYKQLKSDVPCVASEQLKEIYRVLVGGPERIGTSPDREKNDMKRANTISQKILDDAKEDDMIVLFIHGNLIRYMLAHFLNIDKTHLWEQLEIHEASISLIEITKNKTQVRLINSIDHLDKKEVDTFYNKYTTKEYIP